MSAAEAPTTREIARPDDPRIYVASLSDYNAGRLHGAWLDAAVEAEELHEGITAMLANSQESGAEEFAIHDYDNFGPLRLSEYESITTVSAIARGIVTHGEAFAAWAFCLDRPDPTQLDRFEDVYRGRWDSLTAYADDLLDDLGATEVLELIPTWLQPYLAIDVPGFARDLALSGDLITVGSTDGGVHVFEGGSE